MIEFVYGLAEKFGCYNPYEMVGSAPDYVLHEWIAYRKLKNEDYRAQRQWDVLDKESFVAEQSRLLVDKVSGLGES